MYSLDISPTISCSMFGRMKQVHEWEHTGVKTLTENLFVLMIDGNATFTMNNKSHIVSAGDILIIPKHTTYQPKTENFCEYFFFHFSGDIKKVNTPINIPAPNNDFSFLLSKRQPVLVYFEPITHRKPEFDKIYSSIINCVEYQSNITNSQRLLIDIEFLKIMLILGSSFEKTYNNYPPVIEKIRVYIRKNITRNLTLEEISSNCSISTSYASRIFKKHTNITIKEYINNEKLYYARMLLQNTSMNISEVSNYLGYCDAFYFSTLFKRKFGKSPKQFFR
jgi:AraC-like DNA-binding protein